MAASAARVASAALTAASCVSSVPSLLMSSAVSFLAVFSAGMTASANALHAASFSRHRYSHMRATKKNVAITERKGKSVGELSAYEARSTKVGCETYMCVCVSGMVVCEVVATGWGRHMGMRGKMYT